MTTPPASTASTALAASGPVAPTVMFRRDDVGPAFPLGGAVLLLALLAVAAWTWWTARRRAPAGSRWLGAASWAFTSGAARSTASLRVVESTRLDGATRLHVVEWRQHRYLLATSGTAAPLMLDRDESHEQPVRSAP